MVEAKKKEKSVRCKECANHRIDLQTPDILCYVRRIFLKGGKPRRCSSFIPTKKVKVVSKSFGRF